MPDTQLSAEPSLTETQSDPGRIGAACATGPVPGAPFPRRIRTLKDVVDWDLCTGCGACYYACRKGGIALVDVPAAGIRPRFLTQECASCRECLSICPGYSVDARPGAGHSASSSSEDRELGAALEIWQGHAADPEIRYQASSGGLLSALALYCLEREGMAFVLHSGMDPGKPWTNRTVQSRSRQDLLKRAGSRYAPASPCEGLGAIEEAARPCVFIGKPCDAAAVAMLRKERPKLDRNLGLVLTFFCAGTPSTGGTLQLIRSLGAAPEELRAVRYRGEGWPGGFKILTDKGSGDRSLSYQESWGKLTGFRPLRCHLCPDGLGRVADISCGDAWNLFENNGDPGRSVALVRTPRGKEILHRALEAHYVELTAASPRSVFVGQPSLLSRRREIFGRLLGMQALLVPVPRFRGFSLFQSWIRLPFARKLGTVAGTVRRVILRRMWRRRPLQ